MDTASLAERYRELDNDSLLRIAADRKDLTPEAAMALDAELSLRHLGPGQVEELVEGDHAFDKKESLNKVRKMFYGNGLDFYGHWHVEKRLETELYTATRFVSLFYFPLIPLGTYKLIRSRKFPRWISVSTPVQTLPMDWQQVLWIWCRSLLIILAIVLWFRYFVMK